MDAFILTVAFEANNYLRSLDCQLQLARRILEHDLPQPRQRDHTVLGVAVQFVPAEYC
jgi:hypothetical protein